MSLKVNVLFSWLAHAVTLCIGIFLMPYILHTVGDTTYGTWLLLNSIAGQTGLLYLGFGDAISRFTAKYTAEKRWIELNRTFNCITSIYFGSALIAFCLGLLFALLAPLIPSFPAESLSDIRWTIVILGLNAAISIAGSAFGGILMGIQRFDIERGIIIGISAVRLCLTLLFLQAEQGLLTLALIFLAVTVLENLLTCLFAFRFVPHLQLRPRYLRRKVYGRCFSFSLFSFVSLISEHLVYLVDTIVIGFVLGPKAVVPYYIAARLCEMIRSPLIQIGHVFLPKAGELHALQQHEHLRFLVCRGMGVAWLLAAASFAGMLTFGDLLIQTWIGAGYAQSHWILSLLLLGQIVALPTHLLRNVLTGTGYVRLPALLFLLEAVLNLILSLILLQWWGLYGVALGTLLPLLGIELGLLLPLAMKQLQLTWSDVVRHALQPQFVPLALIVMYCLLVRQIPLTTGWITILMIATGAGLVLMAGVGLSQWNEKRRPGGNLLTASLATGGTHG